jgi:hypothetical protein
LHAAVVIEQEIANANAYLLQGRSAAPDRLDFASSKSSQLAELHVKPFDSAAPKFKFARSGGASRLRFHRSGQGGNAVSGVPAQQ